MMVVEANLAEGRNVELNLFSSPPFFPDGDSDFRPNITANTSDALVTPLVLVSSPQRECIRSDCLLSTLRSRR